MCKLYIGSTDDLYTVDNAICLLLQTLLQFFGDRQHRCGTEGIAGVYAKGIDIFNEADSDHVAFCVTDNL